MEQASRLKPFAASAIGSEDRLFFHARLRLAGVSVLILAIIVSGFSYALYQSFATNLQDTAEGDFADTAAQQRVIDATLSAEWHDILMGDLIVLVVVAGIAYALAGRTLRPVRRAVEAQKSFAAHASHELRTPLAVVKNELEVLARNPHKTSTDINAALQDALEEIGRMSEMTENLLALARSEQGSEPVRERVDLHGLLAVVKKSAESIAKAKGVVIEYKNRNQITAIGNRVELERSVLNILHNAIEHTPKGGSVTLTLASESGRALIHVRDTGSGIAASDLLYVFDRFYKGPESTGSGLGLAIVKDIVERHGGAVDIKSKLGEGTIVTLSLPTA